MIFNRYFRMSAVVLSLAVLTVGCKDESWTPGPDTAPDCMGAYFEEMSSYKIILGPEDSRLIPVTIGRSNTEEAVSLPLSISDCPEGVVVPVSVDFAANQQKVTFYVDLENMPPKSSGEIAISLPSDMVSPYGAGTPSVNFSFTISGAWVPVAKSVNCSICDLGGQKLYPDMTAMLYNLDGTDNFKIPDFLGSGIDFIFTMDNPGNGRSSIIPVQNYIDLTDEGWWFYDDVNDTYPIWTPDGVTYPEIAYIEFLAGYNYVQLISDENNNGYLHIEPYIYFDDDSGVYSDINFTFETTFTPYSR